MKRTIVLFALTSALGAGQVYGQPLTPTPTFTHVMFLRLDSGSNNPPAQNYSTSQVDATALQIGIYGIAGGCCNAYTLQQLVFHLSGTVNPVSGIVPGSVRLFQDNGTTPGFHDATDTLVVGGQSFASDGSVTFSGSAVQALVVPNDSTGLTALKLIVVVDLNAPAGTQFSVAINNSSDMTFLAYYNSNPWPCGKGLNGLGNTHNVGLPTSTPTLTPTRTPTLTPTGTDTPFPTPTPTMTGCSKLVFTLSGSGSVTAGDTASLSGDFGYPYGFGPCMQSYHVTDITFDIMASGNLDSRITEVRLRQYAATLATLPFTGSGSYRFTGSPLMSGLDGNHGAFSLDFPTAADAAGTLQMAILYTMPLTMISGYGTAGFAVVLPEPSPVSVTVVLPSGTTPTETETSTGGTVVATSTSSVQATDTPTATYTPTDTVTDVPTFAETPTFTATGCAKYFFYTDTLPANPVSGGQTAVGYSGSGGGGGACPCTWDAASLAFSVNATGNLNTELAEVQLWQGGSPVEALAFTGDGTYTFTGSLSGAFEVRYALSPAALGNIATNIVGASGSGSCGFAPIFIYNSPSTLTVLPLTPAATETPTSVLTPGSTDTPTRTPTITYTDSATPTPTRTPTDSTTATSIPSPSATSTSSVQATPTPPMAATPTSTSAALPLKPVMPPVPFPNPLKEGDIVKVLVALGADSPGVKLQLRTTSGRLVREAELGPMMAGSGPANWVDFSLRGKDGGFPSNGLYFLTVSTTRGKATGKLLILK